jgi:excisionase family DNA binding protein
MEKRFYRIDDVAEMLGVHRNTISNWIKQGKLKTSVIGGIKLIPSTEIDRLEKGE